MGFAPTWYIIIKAAQYLGVAPWDLNNQHPVWREWALMGLEAENLAEKHHHEQADRKAKR